MSELARVFTDAKRVDSRILNRAGVQPLRAVIARLLYRLQAAESDPLAQEVATRGIAVREQFLPADEFDAVLREVEDFTARTLPRWLHQQGTTMVADYSLARVRPEQHPQLAQWRVGVRTLALAAAVERRPLRRGAGNPAIEDVRYGDGSLDDPQRALHVDAVFNTHKIWLYVTDVEHEHGPLVYVPGSHLLDRHRLEAEYRDSTSRVRCVDPSRRVDDDEVRRRRLERLVVTCSANTLVIANTSGYHCRAPGHDGARRLALHLSFRYDPFRYPAPKVVSAIRARIRPRSAGSGAPPPTAAQPLVQ